LQGIEVAKADAVSVRSGEEEGEGVADALFRGQGGEVGRVDCVEVGLPNSKHVGFRAFADPVVVGVSVEKAQWTVPSFSPLGGSRGEVLRAVAADTPVSSAKEFFPMASLGYRCLRETQNSGRKREGVVIPVWRGITSCPAVVAEGSGIEVSSSIHRRVGRSQ